MVTACSEDEAVISNNENLIKEISLSIEGSNTRMAYEATAAGLKFSWVDGEQHRLRIFTEEGGFDG